MRLRTRGVVWVATVVALASAGSGLLLRAQLPQAVGTWAPLGAAAHSRVGAAAVSLSDGRTAIAGGMTPDGIPTDDVALYDPAANSFTPIGHLIGPRVGHTATLLKDGRLLVAGGTMDDLLNADLELFDPSSGSSTLVALMAQPRTGHAAARLADGTVLIVGGSTAGGVVLHSAELFDPSSGSATLLPFGLQCPRVGASATTLIDGRVLVAGGADGTADLGSAEIYDAHSQTFTIVDTQLSVARSGHTAVLLPNNNSVLISGGTSDGVRQPRADLFLPAEFPDPYSYGTGRFAPTGEMTAARSGAIGGPTHVEGYAFVMGGGPADAEAYRFATIKSDKDDYAPGERAIISGSGWQPGEDVTLVFQEDPAVHDDYVLTVTADSEGNIFWDQWAPEEHDLDVRFYLMASDSKSRAQTTFTDGANSLGTISVGTQSPDPVPQGDSASYTITINRAPGGPAGGIGGAFTVNLSLTTVLPTGATASFSPNPVTIASSANTGTSTLTISTTAATPVSLVGTSFTVRGTNLAGGSSNTAQAAGTLKVSSGNTAPTATISLNDHNPKTNDVLTATATRTDADGDPVTLTYVWKNGTTVVKTTPNTSSLTDTLDLSLAGNGNKGDTITVEVTPNDGTVDGAPVTDTALVVNTAPVATVALSDHSPQTNDTLTATATRTDADDDAVSLRYVWKVNGTIKRDVTKSAGTAADLTDTFDLSVGGNGNKGDTITVEVTPNDGDVNGATADDTAVVVNTPPVLTSPGNKTVPEGSLLSFNLAATDADGDPLTFSMIGHKATPDDPMSLVPGTGAFSWTPGDNYSFDVTFSVSDDDGGSDSKTVNISSTNVNPTASNPSLTYDSVTGEIKASLDYEDVGWHDTHSATFNWTIDGVPTSDTVAGNGADTLSAPPREAGIASKLLKLAPGCYSVGVSAVVRDDDGGESAPLTIATSTTFDVYTVAFGPPIMNNERNIAKYGNVVPVKVRITSSCTGAAITSVLLFLSYVEGTGTDVTGTEQIAESVSAADGTGGLMRIADSMSIYNFTTKPLVANRDYTLRVRPGSQTGPVILSAVLQPKK